jgi:hypothetical protein
MKKLYWILSLLFTFACAFSQKQFPVIRNRNVYSPPSADANTGIVQPVLSSVQQPPYDSLVIYRFNTATDSLYESKRIYAYDSKSRKTDELWLSWDIESLSWKNDIKIHYAYDNADSLTLQAKYTYETGKWTGDFKEEKTFDVNGKQVSYILSHEWDSTLNEFIPLIKEESTFNERGDIVLNITLEWLQAENKWRNSLKDSSVYDDQGRQTIQYMYYGDWSSGNWISAGPPLITEYNGLLTTTTQSLDGVPYTKYVYIHDENGNILSDTVYGGDFISKEWKYFMKEAYAYDDNQNRTSLMRATWDQFRNTWYMEIKWESSFDDQNREILLKEFDRYYDTTDWKETVRYERTYNDSGNLVENAYINTYGLSANKVTNHFNNLGKLKSYGQYKGVFKGGWPYPDEWDIASWNLETKGYYYWNEQVQSGIPPIEAGSLQIFPNPAADVICIRGIHGTATLAIYGMQGNLVLLKNAEPDEPVSLSGLSKGMYLAKIRTADGIFERKIVKN